MSKPTQYQTTIGIETHVQLKTKTKLFCRCLNASAETKPNTNICPICLGMPGALPYLNQRAVELALLVGLALNGQVAKTTKFDRKHYFYPDLPKGYQISQYDEPIIGRGFLEVPFESGSFKVGIIRAHLEEDAGKSTHPVGSDYTLVDLNRTGTPLMEIVSEPDISSPAQAKAYAQELYLTMLYAGVSDVDLYRGNMRFDVNISVKPKGAKELGLRTEVKNLNSFRSVEKASEYEVKRQVELLEKGRPASQGTRGWDEAKGKTYALRTKEGEADYRYFPEPDLPPLVLTPKMVSSAKASLPQLPAAIRAQLAKAGLKGANAQTLMMQPRLVELFMAASQKGGAEAAKHIANWLVRDVQAATGSSKFDWQKFTLTAERLVELANMVTSGQLSSNGAEQVLGVMITADKEPQAIAKEQDLLQVSDDKQMEQIVKKVLSANKEAAADYQQGNERSLQFLVGQVMKASSGKANPQMANSLIKKQLDR